MIRLTAQEKNIDTKLIERLFTQGESFSDRICIIIDKVNNEVDVSGCTFFIRTCASNGCMTETVVSKEIQDETILLTWEVSDTLTAVPGKLCMELVGSQEEKIVIKYKMPPIFIKEAVMGMNIPVPDVIEAKLALMNEILEDAAEIAETVEKEGGAVQEVIDARTGALVTNTFPDLTSRLNADFGVCITQGDLEKALSSVTTSYTEADKRVFSQAQSFALAVVSTAAAARYWYDEDGKQNSVGVLMGNYPINEASGEYTISAGAGTIARSDNQAVYGLYNVIDSENKYLLIFGIGTDDENRANGHTLDHNGNAWYAGDVTATNTAGEAVSLAETAAANMTHSALAQSTIGMPFKKNLLKNTASSTTKNGVTFTVGDDGSVTVSGTATADTELIIRNMSLSTNTHYTLTGCPSGGSTSTYYLYTMNTTTWSGRRLDVGTSAAFSTGEYTGWTFRICIVSGYTADNLTFYPMLRRSDITDSTFEAYTDDLQTQINALKAAIESLGGTVSTLEYEPEVSMK